MLSYDNKIDLKFTVFGDPVGKSRPRFTKTGRVYTPQKSAAYEKSIQQAAWVAMKHHKLQPTDRPVHVDLVAYLPIAESWTKQKKREALSGAIRPNKPDLDNIMKSVFDGCNQIVFLDDQQVHSVKARKLYRTYDKIPSIEVCVSWTNDQSGP